MRHRHHRHREGRGGKGGLVELHQIGPALLGQPGNGGAGRRDHGRIAGQPVERQARVDQRRTHRLRPPSLARIGGRPDHRQFDLIAAARQSGGEFGRILPDAADRIDGHQQSSGHAATSTRVRAAVPSRRSQSARSATPSRQPIRSPSSSAWVAARVSATK